MQVPNRVSEYVYPKVAVATSNFIKSDMHLSLYKDQSKWLLE